MGLTLFYGTGFWFRYDFVVPHEETAIRAFLAQQGYSQIDRVRVLLVGGYEFPVVGTVSQEYEYRAYDCSYSPAPIADAVEPHPTLADLQPMSSYPTAPDAAVPESGRTLTLMQPMKPRDTTESDLHSVSTAPDAAEAESCPILPNSRSMNPDETCNSVKPPVDIKNVMVPPLVEPDDEEEEEEWTDDEDMDSPDKAILAKRETVTVCSYDKNKVSKSVLDTDFVSSLNRIGIPISELVKGSIMLDKRTRCRIVRQIGRLLLLGAKKTNFPTRDDRLFAISQLQGAHIRVCTEIFNEYLTKFGKNQRARMRKASLLPPSVFEIKRSISNEVVPLLSPEMGNTEMQNARDGSPESLKLMEMTRWWRITQGRIELSHAITKTRQICDWHWMTIRDSESLFKTDLASFLKSYDKLVAAIDALWKKRVPDSIQNTMSAETDPLKKLLCKLVSILMTITSKAKGKNAIEELFFSCQDGTLADAVLSASRTSKGKRSKKKNGDVQPSLMNFRGVTYVIICGRPVRVGDDAEASPRALFLLSSFYMCYNLTYTEKTSDLLCTLEILAKFPKRRGLSLAARTLCNSL